MHVLDAAPEEQGPLDLVHLVIFRNDLKPLVATWEALQEIKNAFVGPDCEAVELFPSEARCVRDMNMRHLWALRRSGELWPVGFNLPTTGAS